MMLRLLRKMHSYLYLGAVLFFFSLFYPLLAILAKNPERHFHRIAKCRRMIGFLSSACSGFFYRFAFEESIDWSKPYIICPNHTSNLDINAMVLLCPADFVFMGKTELLGNPVTRMFFRTIDIAVNRESKISSFKAFKRAQENLAKGRSMLIFPEGLIGAEYPPHLHPFKNGPFKLAIELDIPVIPVVIHDAWKIYWDDAKRYGSRPGVVHIDVLKPIHTNMLETANTHELRNEVDRRIRERWNSTGGL